MSLRITYKFLLIFSTLLALAILVHDRTPDLDSVSANSHVTDPEIFINAKITSVKHEGSCPDDWWFGCGNADFYSRVDIDGVQYTTPYVGDDNNISPNWQFPSDGGSQLAVYQSGKIDFEIRLWDKDGDLRGDDDAMSISGGSKTFSADIKWNAQLFSGFTLSDGGGVIPFEEIEPNQWKLSSSADGSGGSRASVEFEISIFVNQLDQVVDPSISINRPLAVHLPIHPSDTDVLTLRAASVDEHGMPVPVGDIEIWIDEDGSESQAEMQRLTGSTGGSCTPGTGPLTFCIETIDLSTVLTATTLDDDEQRTFSYGVRIVPVGQVPELGYWSGWRTITVGNRTNADVIGFSIGQTHNEYAVDLLYSPMANDFGASGCSVSVAGVTTCATAMTTSLALAAIEDNWLNSFFTSFDYSPNNFGAKTDTFAHLDLILANANRFNFYYTTVPSSGLGYVDSNSTPPVTPAKCDGNPPMRIDPTTGNAVQITGYDTIFLFHSSIFRDCTAGSDWVTIEALDYIVTLHEMGHRPFGNADIYCCDGGNFEAADQPNLFAEQADCDASPVLGTGPSPAISANTAPCPSFVRNSGSDWFRPESASSLMGTESSTILHPDGVTTILAQAGPASTNRFMWYLNRCQQGLC